MININTITLPTSLDSFTKLVKENEQILYSNIANHINNNSDRHTASEILFESGSGNTVQSELDSLIATVANINLNISKSESLLKQTQELVQEAKDIADTKTSTTINGKFGDVILKQGAGIIIKEEVETGGAIFTINNTITGGVVVTGNTGRQFTYTFNLAAVVAPESIPNLDLVIVDSGVSLMASTQMKVYDATNGTAVLQTIQANIMTTIQTGGILRVAAEIANVSIYVPRIA